MIKIKPKKVYLISGGTGFLGQLLVERLISFGANVRVVARNEGKLIELHEKFPQISYITGDVSEYSIAHQAMKNVTGVFHLAAFKHVGLAEKQSKECIKSNVIGSLNILDLSLHAENLDFVIGISTDKAAQVSGVYGATKMLMESLFHNYEQMNDKVKYRLVRYGNVLYSTGSVLCKWKKLLSEGKDVIVTDKNATRFYWTVEQAVDLIFNCLENAVDSKPFVPGMKACSIENLLKAMQIKYGIWEFDNTNVPEGFNPPYGPFESVCVSKVKEIGLQKGENLHEKILENGPYSNEVEQYTVEEMLELI